MSIEDLKIINNLMFQDDFEINIFQQLFDYVCMHLKNNLIQNEICVHGIRYGGRRDMI